MKKIVLYTQVSERFLLLKYAKSPTMLERCQYWVWVWLVRVKRLYCNYFSTPKYSYRQTTGQILGVPHCVLPPVPASSKVTSQPVSSLCLLCVVWSAHRRISASGIPALLHTQKLSHISRICVKGTTFKHFFLIFLGKPLVIDNAFHMPTIPKELIN